MNRIQSKLEKKEARLNELIKSTQTLDIDKKRFIKQRKTVEDKLKYFLLGMNEQKNISNIKVRKAKEGEKIYKNNYKLIWRKLKEEEKRRRVCFCGGDKIFRPICSECQKWRDEIVFPVIKEWILTNQKKKDLEDFFFFIGKTFEKDLDKVEYNIDNLTPTVQKASLGGKE